MGIMAYAWLLPLLPLVVFVIVLASGRRLPRMLAPGLGIAATVAVFAASMAFLWFTAQGVHYSITVPWMRIGTTVVELGYQIDPLTAMMLVVVSFVSLLVQVYSMGYMEDEDRFRWYYGAISLFTAAMLGVVIANGWLLMYMCWEMMGLASYLLIGFWFEDPTAARAASKAFMVTRIGDVGFGLSLVLMWVFAGSFQFEHVFKLVESGGWVGPSLVAAALLLFMGAMGKSAQFPLHVWLPDAMAGPTPGSALIHAATMVAAGVYLVARSFPLFEANPQTLTVVAVIGTITAVMAAITAVAMNDIKKVLAYSTISQLGLMMLALGVGSWTAAVFHLMTHAFFKALLFLAAGSVIHGTHTQDMREMGGLWRKMPWTTATWVIGALSLAGIPPLAGFWSKDEILLAILHSGQPGFLVAGLFTVILTAFYMGRATFMTFFMKPGPDSQSEHAHESPWVMTAPLVILATLAVAAGIVGSPLANYALGSFLGEHVPAETNLLLMAVAVGAAVAGIAYAWSMYVRGAIQPDWYLHNGFVNRMLSRSFWIDDVYQVIVVHPVIALSRLLRRLDHEVIDAVVRTVGFIGLTVSAFMARFDRKAIDGTVDEVGETVIRSGRDVRKIQTGNVQTYLLLLFASIVVLVLVFAR